VPGKSDDAGLVRRIGRGDESALRSLYERYGAIVYGMAHRLLGDPQLAEECAQDVFVAVWRNADSYDERRAQVTTWLFTIARNRAFDLSRRRSARPVELQEDPSSADEAPDTADLVAAADRSARVAAALAELSDVQREALSLAYFEELSQSEIAERLDIPIGTVKGRIRLALDHLRTVAPTYALDVERQS
jgi:RNA polymerase sigma-70 factor (ECF subfamily)